MVPLHVETGLHQLVLAVVGLAIEPSEERTDSTEGRADRESVLQVLSEPRCIRNARVVFPS